MKLIRGYIVGIYEINVVFVRIILILNLYVNNCMWLIVFIEFFRKERWVFFFKYRSYFRFYIKR